MRKAELVKITPEIAKRFLEKNLANRKLSNPAVARYASDMRNGKWGVPSTIIFDSNGNLIDGQHRLNAIVKSNTPTEFIILTDETSKVGIDRGRVRTTVDTLIMNGYPNKVANNQTVGAIKLLHSANHASGTASDSTISNYIDHFKKELIDTTTLTNTGTSRPISRKSPVLVGTFCALRCAKNYDATYFELRHFFEVVNTGFCDCDEKYAAIVLRNYLIENNDNNNPARLARWSVTEQAIRDYLKKTARRRRYSEYIYVYKDIVLEEDKVVW